MLLARSYLYVPGNAPARFDKAVASIADAVIIDLEDAVPLPSKDAAREQVSVWLQSRARGDTQIWVRVNSGAERLADLAALESADNLTGLVLAKTESADDVLSVRNTLAEQGHADRLLCPLLETAAAIFDAVAIARQPQVDRLQIGEYDLCAELGITPDDSEAELQPARSHVVMASSAAGIAPPVAPVSIEIKDTARLRDTTERAARQGFVGRACIHPAQLDVIHEVFTPNEAAVEQAKAILAAFRNQVDKGASVFVDSHGRLLDEAVVRQARRTLGLAQDRTGDPA